MKISIVTPSFNQAQYLEATMRSVLEQQYPELEYVVIDAGSSDGSVDVIRRYEDRLAYWVSEPDRGHADGLNKGFAHTSGEVMAWINSSDAYYPWTLRTVAQIFNDVPEAQWITGMPTALSEGVEPKLVYESAWNLYDFLSGNYHWVQQESVFWRRSLWETAGGALDVTARYACDFELWCRFMEHAPLYHVPTILGGYRYHDERRGREVEGGGRAYPREAAEIYARWSPRFSEQDRWKANVVRITNNELGRVVRKSLKKAGLLRWYRHPRVAYDMESRRWVGVSA